RVDAADGARVASVIGRYFAMDRDNRWERTALAYELLTRARAPHAASSGEEAARLAYARGETDEFIEPTVVGAPAPISASDAVLARAGVRQLHVAETEKYPHVTYFFNGGDEDPVAGERRELVPSPRDVPTYDHKPQMSAPRPRPLSCAPGARTSPHSRSSTSR